MDDLDLSEKLGSVLSDPESMNKVRMMAEQLLGHHEEEPSVPEGVDTAKLLSLLGRFKSAGGGDREKLLLALRPHLHNDRQKRVDTAIRILKLIELAPLLKDTGLLELF